jgi:hypothetical protein
VDGDLLYAIGSHGDLVCLEVAGGKERWRKSFARDFGGRMMSGWGFSESPLIDGEKLLCTPGGADALVVALNKETGEVIWKCAASNLGPKGKDGAGYASIVISEACGVRQYVQMTGKGLIGVAAKDGKLLWNYNRVANGTANIANAICKGDYVFGSTSYSTGSVLLKLTAADGGVKAEEVYFLGPDVLQNHHGGLILLGDHVYAGHGRNAGAPVCIEMKTGKVAWKDKAPGGGSAAFLFADGNLYVRYESGLMTLIEATPEAFKLKSSFQLPVKNGPSWPHPVIVDGKLYLRDHDALMCYEVQKH